MTLHPRAENRTLIILSPLKESAWTSGLLVLVLLVMGIILTASESDLCIHMILWYTLEAIGQVREGQRYRPNAPFRLSGNAFYVFWMTTLFFMISAYNVELRAKTINQKFEKLPSSIYDLEVPQHLFPLVPQQGTTSAYVSAIFIWFTC